METVNQVQTENTNTEEAAKTFTQAEVDKIVEGRLQRERAKYGDMSDYDQLKEKAGKYDQLQEASKTELQKATEKVTSLQKELDGMKHEKAVSSIRAKVAKEKGIPEHLLTADTEDFYVGREMEYDKTIRGEIRMNSFSLKKHFPHRPLFLRT